MGIVKDSPRNLNGGTALPFSPIRLYNRGMLSGELIRKLGTLARLIISDEEVPTLLKDVNLILNYVQKLEELDVSTVTPMSHVHGSTNVFRDDVIGSHLDTESALKNAPDLSGRYIRVPLIVEE
jgi:aspartyl-tRNA(Asn)/glutamyl-tRNA(Gln) amidotransferase subunit C